MTPRWLNVLIGLALLAVTAQFLFVFYRDVRVWARKKSWEDVD